MKSIVYTAFTILLIAVSCKSKVTNAETGSTFKDVDVTQAKAMIESNKDLVILDVRTPKETDLGTIPNAIKINYFDENFDEAIGKLDKSKSYLVYCRSGGRSVKASNKMIEAGFTDITNMMGGYTAWSEQ